MSQAWRKALQRTREKYENGDEYAYEQLRAKYPIEYSTWEEKEEKKTQKRKEREEKDDVKRAKKRQKVQDKISDRWTFTWFPTEGTKEELGQETEEMFIRLEKEQNVLMVMAHGEICPETGRKHVQGALWLTFGITQDGVCKLIDPKKRPHVGIMKGTVQDNYNYIVNQLKDGQPKGDTWWEEPVLIRQENRHKILEIGNSLKMAHQCAERNWTWAKFTTTYKEANFPKSKYEELRAAYREIAMENESKDPFGREGIFKLKLEDPLDAKITMNIELKRAGLADKQCNLIIATPASWGKTKAEEQVKGMNVFKPSRAKVPMEGCKKEPLAWTAGKPHDFWKWEDMEEATDPHSILTPITDTRYGVQYYPEGHRFQHLVMCNKNSIPDWCLAMGQPPGPVIAKAIAAQGEAKTEAEGKAAYKKVIADWKLTSPYWTRFKEYNGYDLHLPEEERRELWQVKLDFFDELNKQRKAKEQAAAQQPARFVHGDAAGPARRQGPPAPADRQGLSLI